MPDLPTPTATRLRRPSWRDGRLLVGILLVLLSSVIGSLAMAHADDRIPVYAAKVHLLPGEALTAERLTRVDVQLGDSTAAYLSAAADLAPETYVLREVRQGELVPLTALGGRDQVSLQPLTLMVDATSASALVVGSVVDAYVNPPVKGSSTGDFEGPELALQAVSVSRLAKSSTGLGSAATAAQAVQVMAPVDQVKDLIAKVDVGAKVTLVPVPGSRVRTDR
jgi:hypothetical protein